MTKKKTLSILWALLIKFSYKLQIIVAWFPLVLIPLK